MKKKQAREAKKPTKAVDQVVDDSIDSDNSDLVRAGFVIDFISGTKKFKETPREMVRQRIARALFHEYGISLDDMESNFLITVDGHHRRLDIAIFAPGKPHTDENLRRIVVCRPEPKRNKRDAVKLRSYDQAAKDIAEIKPYIKKYEECEYGLWTNGFEFYFLRKKVTRSQIDAEPISDWPPGDESIDTRDVVSHAKARQVKPEMLRTTFRRCFNFIHGNEGMPKDAAFWQFLYLIFCKMYDERAPRKRRRFWAGPREQFTEEGCKEISKRIFPLFDEVKQEYKTIFRGKEKISLSPRALAFMVSELGKYEFTRIDADAKSAAYQEIVGPNLRGDRSQYFTPRGAIKLVVDILNPKEGERILDPICGTGGFLVATLAHMMNRFREEAKVRAETETSKMFESLYERLRRFASEQVFGCDFDPFLIRASQMNMVMAGDGKGHLYYINSLEFPNGYLKDLKAAKKDIPFESMDILMTNPPFSSDIPVTDENILKHFHLAHIWEKAEDGSFRETSRLQSSTAPEILFIERCLDWLKPGGRMGIILPNGILNNPAVEFIRWWILRNAWVLASVDLPVEVFVAEAKVGIFTSALFLKKKPLEVIKQEDISGQNDYPVFMAVAEKVGFDRRGKVLNKLSPEGKELIQDVEEIESITVDGRKEFRTLRRKEKVVDNDLPEIAERYRLFRQKHAEPGK